MILRERILKLSGYSSPFWTRFRSNIVRTFFSGMFDGRNVGGIKVIACVLPNQSLQRSRLLAANAAELQYVRPLHFDFCFLRSAASHRFGY